MKEYALYKGDELLEFGTIKYIASKLRAKESTIKWYGTEAYKKRIKNSKNAKILIKIED